MDFNKLFAEELASIGIKFETQAEICAFANLILRELELRIGEEISRRLTEEQLDKFDSCEEPEEGRKWLEKNCPAYRKIVFHKKRF